MNELYCGTCTACCRCGWVVLHPELGDDLSRYLYTQMDIGPVLLRKSSGACIYLDQDGCTIYEKRPTVCRAFDCRDYAKTMRDNPEADRTLMEAGLMRS